MGQNEIGTKTRRRLSRGEAGGWSGGEEREAAAGFSDAIALVRTRPLREARGSEKAERAPIALWRLSLYGSYARWCLCSLVPIFIWCLALSLYGAYARWSMALMLHGAYARWLLCRMVPMLYGPFAHWFLALWFLPLLRLRSLAPMLLCSMPPMPYACTLDFCSRVVE